MSDMRFTLDKRLAADTVPVLTLGLCQLLLMNDARWPWLILVPQRAEITESHELTPLDQTMLAFETNTVSEAFKALTGCKKINIAAIGNMVPQLHIHVIARNEDDPNWPKPVWGYEKATPYKALECAEMVARLRAAF